MLTEREEHAGEWERGLNPASREQQEEDWGAEDGISGRLGRAFYAGGSVRLWLGRVGGKRLWAAAKARLSSPAPPCRVQL